MNKQLREKLEDIINDRVAYELWFLHQPLLGTKTGMTMKKAINTILSAISEALPKEQKEHKTLIVEYGYGRKTQIHPLSDWDLGYNQCLSDIHQLLKKDTL